METGESGGKRGVTNQNRVDIEVKRAVYYGMFSSRGGRSMWRVDYEGTKGRGRVPQNRGFWEMLYGEWAKDREIRWITDELGL